MLHVTRVEEGGVELQEALYVHGGRVEILLLHRRLHALLAVVQVVEVLAALQAVDDARLGDVQLAHLHRLLTLINRFIDYITIETHFRADVLGALARAEQVRAQLRRVALEQRQTRARAVKHARQLPAHVGVGRQQLGDSRGEVTLLRFQIDQSSEFFTKLQFINLIALRRQLLLAFVDLVGKVKV